MASSAPVSPPAIGHEEGKDTTTTSTSSQAKLPEFVEATMPPGVAIRPNAYGLGLFATHAFGKGDTLYITSCLYVPDVLGKLKLRLTDSGEEFELDMKEHSVLQSDTGMRQLYSYDAFMNHSCAPNTTSFVTDVTAERLEYGMKALCCISPGQELTCDYSLFEFEAGDASILSCQCGATDCLKQIKGFKYLTCAQALPRFATAEPYVLASYLEEHPELRFVDLRQEGEEEAVVDMAFQGGGCTTVAKRAWAAGDVLLQGVRLSPPTKATTEALIVALAPGVARGSDTLDLSTTTGETKEFWVLRFLFGGGSRSGGKGVNVKVEKEEKGTYKVVATAPLAVGDQLVMSDSSL